MGTSVWRVVARVCALFVSISFLVAACGSDTAEERARVASLAEGCLIDSDCRSPLVCAFQRCHVQCVVQRDCQREELCVPAEEHKVCLLEDERFCADAGDCPGDQLVCKESACRPVCLGESECASGQVCLDGACGTCVYNSECTAPLVCKAGQCLVECNDNRDCPPGSSCNAQGVCVFSGTTDGGATDGGSDSSTGDGGPGDASVTIPTCSNGALDPGESGVDCGGSCGACDGQPCTKPKECASNICTGQQCTAPTCSDGQQNGSESDVDCGGSCAQCQSAKGCWTTKDCVTGSCVAGLCTAPQCQDKLLNGTETDVDCGGGQCAACAIGNTCAGNGDCSSANCVDKKCVNAGPTSWVSTVEQSLREVRVATDSQGNSIVLWEFGGTQDFGKGPLIASFGGLALTKFTPAGAVVDTPRLLDGPSYETPKSVATDASGDILVLADSGAPPDFGGGPLDCGGSNNAIMVIAKYKSDLSPSWSHCFRGTNTSLVTSAGTVDSQGNLIVTGTLTGVVDFNRDFGGSVQSGDKHLFVAKYSGATGSLLEFKKYFGTSLYTPIVAGIATAGSDVFLTGAFFEQTTIGTDTLTPKGNYDIFVIKLNSKLDPVKAVSFGGVANDFGHAIAVVAAQSVIVAGDFQGQVDFKNGFVKQAVGAEDIVLLKLAQSDLATERAESYGSSGTDVPKAVAVSGNGEIALAGVIPAAVNFGSGPVTHFGGGDGFWARLSASNLAHIYSESFGTINGDEAQSVAYAGTNLLLGGTIASGGIVKIANQTLPLTYASFAAMIEP